MKTNHTQEAPSSRHPWRYVCPRGHHSWQANSQSVAARRYRCRACEYHNDDPFFAGLVDKLDA